MKNLLSKWQFEEPPETLVMVETVIIKDHMPILCVARLSEKKGWYFGHAEIIDLEKVVTVRLMDVLEIDKSLTNVCRMPVNWIARKNVENGTWVFVPESGRVK